jgi:hypothetical protein
MTDWTEEDALRLDMRWRYRKSKRNLKAIAMASTERW